MGSPSAPGKKLGADAALTTRRLRRAPSPALKLAKEAAKVGALKQRAKLIGAGLEILTKKRGKYNQVRTTRKGEKYDSLGEAEYSAKLDRLKSAGQIREWSRPKPITLVHGPTPRSCVTYKPDFFVTPISGQPYYVDFKGSRATETAAWKIKVKIWAQSIVFELRVAYPSGEEKIVCPARQYD